MPDTPLPWIDAWHDALYGPDGFYRRTEGPAGHFATSAQGIPGVSEILAQTVAALAERCDADVVVDFACGRGELAESLPPFIGEDVEVIGVDVIERPATLDLRVAWVRSPGGEAVPPLDALAGRRALVIAHEWLDVVPCVIAEADDDGVLREVLVTHDGTESLGAPLTDIDLGGIGPPDLDEQRAASHHPDAHPGERVEISRTRDAAWTRLVDEVRRHAAPGSVVVGVDYGVTAQTRSPLGTLTGFRDGVECTPVPDGTCDITAHVAVDSLDVDTCVTQRDLMLDLFGAEPLDPVPVELATTNPPLYLQRLAVRSALAAAVHPDGLGAFFWFTKTV